MKSVVKKIGISLAVIVGIVISLFVLILIPILIDGALQPAETLFYVMGNMFNSIFIIEIIVVFLPFSLLNAGKESRSVVLKYIKKFWYILLIIIVLCEYLIASDVTYVSNDTFVKRSALNPAGKKYSYSDVVSIDAGIYRKGLYKKGDFYYIVQFSDGKKVNLVNSGSTNEDKVENYDSYREIEMVDKSLLKNNIKKTADTESIERCDYDQKYKDIISGILNNK